VNAFAFSKSDYYVFQTDGAKACFKRKTQNKSSTIPNLIANMNVQTNEVITRYTRIVNAARLDIYQKRQNVLIEAFNKFYEFNSDYTLNLYGDGTDEDKLRALAKGNDWIIFHGASKQVLNKIKTAACLF